MMIICNFFLFFSFDLCLTQIVLSMHPQLISKADAVDPPGSIEAECPPPRSGPSVVAPPTPAPTPLLRMENVEPLLSRLVLTITNIADLKFLCHVMSCNSDKKNHYHGIDAGDEHLSQVELDWRPPEGGGRPRCLHQGGTRTQNYHRFSHPHHMTMDDGTLIIRVLTMIL